MQRTVTGAGRDVPVPRSSEAALRRWSDERAADLAAQRKTQAGGPR